MPFQSAHFGEGFGLAPAESGLTLGGEDLADRPTGAPLEQRVGIDPRPAEFGRQQARHGGLAAAARADEEDTRRRHSSSLIAIGDSARRITLRNRSIGAALPVKCWNCSAAWRMNSSTPVIVWHCRSRASLMSSVCSGVYTVSKTTR